MFYYRKELKYIPIGQKRIASKCPTCGNTDVLELIFYQKEVTTGLVITMTKKVSGILYCHHTKTEIPPVQWSDSTINYFETEKTKLKLLPTGRKKNKQGFKILFWFLSLFFILLAGVYTYFKYFDKNDLLGIQEPFAGIEINDKLKVEVQLFDNNGGTAIRYFNVNKIVNDTVYIQEHQNSIENIDTLNLKEADFNAKVYKLRYDSFKIGYLTQWDNSMPLFSGFTKK